MKHKNIDLDGIDIEINIDAAKSFIEHRIGKKKPLTQRAFDQAMTKSLQAFKVNMTPTELIDFTVEKGWDGINLAFTVAAKNREMMAIGEVKSNTTRQLTTQDMLSDRSWAD